MFIIYSIAVLIERSSPTLEYRLGADPNLEPRPQRDDPLRRLLLPASSDVFVVVQRGSLAACLPFQDH